MTRRLIPAALLVLLAATIAQAALPAFDTSQLYTEAKFNAAIKPYTDAIARSANDAEAHYWLGVAYLHGARLNRFGLAPYAQNFAAKAVTELEQAMKLRPNLVTLTVLLDAYSMVGDRDKYDAAFNRFFTITAPAPLVK